jgi:hypothetical protein
MQQNRMQQLCDEILDVFKTRQISGWGWKEWMMKRAFPNDFLIEQTSVEYAFAGFIQWTCSSLWTDAEKHACERFLDLINDAGLKWNEGRGDGSFPMTPLNYCIRFGGWPLCWVVLRKVEEFGIDLDADIHGLTNSLFNLDSSDDFFMQLLLKLQKSAFARAFQIIRSKESIRHRKKRWLRIFLNVCVINNGESGDVFEPDEYGKTIIDDLEKEDELLQEFKTGFRDIHVSRQQRRKVLMTSVSTIYQFQHVDLIVSLITNYDLTDNMSYDRVCSISFADS